MDSQCNSSDTVFLVHGICDFLHFFLTCFKHHFIVITNDVGKSCCGNVAGHIGQMIETFSSLGVGRRFHWRKLRLDLTCNESGIDHDIFRLTRVDIHAFDSENCACGIKVFIGNLALIIAIYRVGKICFKVVKIKQIRTTSDFLIRCKTDPDIAVWNVRGDELFSSSHDLSNACLIVCTKQSCAVCRDQGSAL